MSHARAIAFFVGLALLAGKLASASQMVDRVVAVVNDEIILESEVDQMARAMTREPPDLNSLEGRQKWIEAKTKILDTLVDHRLVRQQASELKLSVTPEEIDRALEEVKKQNNLDDTQLTEALKQQGLTPESYRKDLRQQMIEMKVMNTMVISRVRVSDEEVRTAYAQRERQVSGDKAAHLLQLLVAVPKGAAPAEIESKRKVANEIMAEIRGGKPFIEVAKARSDDAATRGDGGDIGWVKKGTLQEPLDEVVAGMDGGDLRGPIQTERGFYVLQVTERKVADMKSFEEAKETLHKEIYEQQVQKAQASFVKELRKKAHVDMRLTTPPDKNK